jgi:hypothetical protein
MATTTNKSQCSICQKERSAVRCEGCFQIFCYDHLNDHRQELSKILDEMEMNRDEFRQTLNEQIIDPKKHSLIKQIDQWELDSIALVQQTATKCREGILEKTGEHFKQMEIQLTELTDRMIQIRRENDFNEIDIEQLKGKLIKLGKKLDQISNVSIQEDLKPLIKQISIVSSSGNTTIFDRNNSIVIFSYFSNRCN